MGILGRRFRHKRRRIDVLLVDPKAKEFRDN